MAAAAAITAKYEIGHNLKSIQVRDPIFFPRPMFSRVRNAMKLSFGNVNYLLVFKRRQRGSLFLLVSEIIWKSKLSGVKMETELG